MKRNKERLIKLLKEMSRVRHNVLLDDWDDKLSGEYDGLVIAIELLENDKYFEETYRLYIEEEQDEE